MIATYHDLVTSWHLLRVICGDGFNLLCWSVTVSLGHDTTLSPCHSLQQIARSVVTTNLQQTVYFLHHIKKPSSDHNGRGGHPNKLNWNMSRNCLSGVDLGGIPLSRAPQIFRRNTRFPRNSNPAGLPFFFRDLRP